MNKTKYIYHKDKATSIIIYKTLIFIKCN